MPPPVLALRPPPGGRELPRLPDDVHGRASSERSRPASRFPIKPHPRGRRQRPPPPPATPRLELGPGCGDNPSRRRLLRDAGGGGTPGPQPARARARRGRARSTCVRRRKWKISPGARQVVRARANIIGAMPCQEGNGDQPQVIGDSSLGGGIRLGPSGHPRNSEWSAHRLLGAEKVPPPSRPPGRDPGWHPPRPAGLNPRGGGARRRARGPRDGPDRPPDPPKSGRPPQRRPGGRERRVLIGVVLATHDVIARAARPCPRHAPAGGPARRAARGRSPSLFYTRTPSTPAVACFAGAPGSRTCQQRAMSCSRCRPSPTVCGPGSSSRFRFTEPPRWATLRTSSWSFGGSLGGCSRRTTWSTDCPSPGSNTASQLISGQLRPSRQTDHVRHVTIRSTGSTPGRDERGTRAGLEPDRPRIRNPRPAAACGARLQ